MKSVHHKLVIFLLAVALPFAASAEKRDRSVAEMKQSIREKASKIDVNNDGILSDEETAARKSKLGFLAGAITNLVDANKDGVVTVAEYENAQVREIEVADKDKNGMLSVAEQKEQQRELVKKLFAK